jgi:hypothetical protein
MRGFVFNSVTRPAFAKRRILRAAALGCLLSFGLALGACSKCDVPTWMPQPPAQAPKSCHDLPSPQ